MKFLIDKTWNGGKIPASEHASAHLSLDPLSLLIEVEAPFNRDPPPAGAPGSTDQLWTHEVVEIFLLGAGGRYLEVELGPHGHYLVLLLAGVRRIEGSPLAIEYSARIKGGSWQGRARVPIVHLPEGLARGNSYAIRGEGERRRYFAAWPVPGNQPDFHQPSRFGPLRLTGLPLVESGEAY